MKRYRWLVFSAIAIATLVILFFVFGNRSLEGGSIVPASATGADRDYKKDWKRYVTVQVGGGIKIALGGFKNVTLYVANAMPYPVKHLKITVKYIRANRDIYKTETVEVHNLVANGAQIVHIPDSRRGMRLDLSISSIDCPELDLHL